MIATQPALFVTFICARDSENGVADGISHLARPEAEGGLALSRHAANEWRNSSQETWARRFAHPELPDVSLLQVALNPADATADAARGWIIAWEKLERALKEMPATAQEALIGRTLVYQAVLPAESDGQAASSALLAQNCLRATNGHLAHRALAQAGVAGGHLWLLATPSGAAQESIYLALGPLETQDRLNLDILFGPSAALIWPDAVAHKAYFMSRDYFATQARKRFRQASDDLRQKTVALLQQNNSSAKLDDLSTRVANLATVMAELRRLHSGLEIHQANYERSLGGSAFDDAPNLNLASHGAVAAYHRQQISNRLLRIHLDLTDASAALEAAKIAIRTVRTKYSQRQAEEAKKQPLSVNDYLSFADRAELVEHLLLIPSIADRATLETVIEQLPSEIKMNIRQASVHRTHVLNIVKTCLQYPAGMQNLSDILQFFERDSIPMQRFKKAIGSLLPRG